MQATDCYMKLYYKLLVVEDFNFSNYFNKNSLQLCDFHFWPLLGDQWFWTSGGARLRGHAVFLKCSKSSLTWYAIRVFLWWPLPETSSFTSLTLPTSTLTLVIPVNHKWPRLTATQTIKRRNIPLDTNCFANKSLTHFQIKQFYMSHIIWHNK